MFGMAAVEIAQMIIFSDTIVHSAMCGWRGCHNTCVSSEHDNSQ